MTKSAFTHQLSDSLVLTTEHPQSSYGVPVLICTDNSDPWVAGAGDEFPQACTSRIVSCGEVVAAWAHDCRRTAEERRSADLFCRSNPTGHQIDRDIETGVLTF